MAYRSVMTTLNENIDNPRSEDLHMRIFIDDPTNVSWWNTTSIALDEIQ